MMDDLKSFLALLKEKLSEFLCHWQHQSDLYDDL